MLWVGGSAGAGDEQGCDVYSPAAEPSPPPATGWPPRRTAAADGTSELWVQGGQAVEDRCT